MHTSFAILSALSVFSYGVEATPVKRSGTGFSLQQQEVGQVLKSGPIALGNVYKKVNKAMPSKVASAFVSATQAAPSANINRRQVVPTVVPAPDEITDVPSAADDNDTDTTTLISGVDVLVSKPKATTSSSTPAGTATAQVTANPVNSYDTAYMIPIQLGNNTVYVDLDTGSSDLWSFSSLQPASESAGHNLYTPGTSAKQLNGYSWGVNYLDGSSASGLVYNDTIVLGGTTFNNQIIGAANSTSSSFVGAAYDGMLGLAFDNLNSVSPKQQKTLFSSIMSQLKTPLFTSNLKHNSPGTYNFGYIDSSQYTGSIAYTNVDSSNGWWQFTTTGYSVGSNATVSQSYAGVVDTGTTLMVLPSSIVSAYYSQVANATFSNDYGAWIYPCSANLPNFNIVIGANTATVPGSLMTYGPIDYVGNCYGGLQQNDNIGVAIYGDIFIKSQFIVYDRSTSPPRLGFAKQASS